ncbi:ATP-binding protein [Methylomonas sp. SURF-2]|uniref:histidine kinase n=1 Tax=Methylomonas subterranea TaxID=2952225 RepID=A0ABT1TP04_9GAMM|nr:ATP-binding protein [Methylomonas sp. SURF-2]MCQ8106459.1 ATP-binding protein [Methylomonas sp. SURF-2]
MRRLLLRPIIFVTLIMSLLVLGELIAIGRLTWQNHQRIQTIQTDIGKGHRLQETIFELLQLQSKIALHQNDPAQTADQTAELESRLLDLLEHLDSSEFNVSLDLQNLQAKFGQAIHGDARSMIDTVELIQAVLNQQTVEEEKLLIGVETDSQLELQLAVVLPLILIWIGQYFFRNNVLEPLEALRVLLSGLAEGVKQPIRISSPDPVINDLFERYNHLVAHLIELEQSHLDYTNKLESQVRQTSHKLLEQSQRLAKAERLAALTEMAASTAHELRNPLAVIQVALENMRAESTDPDFRERLGLLHREVQRLTNHLNDLLGNARNSGETARAIPVNTVIRELITLLGYQASDSIRFELSADDEIVAVLPETEFRQVLLNLLQNAAQAIGERPGTVRVDVGRTAQHLRVSVTDSGGGFNAELLRQGIRPFVSLKEKGSGLGLAMVQRFVRDMQGQLKLANNPDGHACVTLSLPLSPA